MSDSYVTIAGDTVDGVLYREIGRNDDDLEAEFWRLNPSAALHTADGVHFPVGVVLLLPDKNIVRSVEVVSPWD